MNQETKDGLKEAGLNLESVLKRLMNNEGLLERLLVKFKSDLNYAGLKQALEERRYEDAFHYAHSLKGVAGNLGMDRLMEADAVLVEKLRGGVYEGLEDDMKELASVYDHLIDVIEKMG